MPAKKAAVAPPTSPFSFSYEEYEDWYANAKKTLLEPARSTFDRLIDEWLDRELNDLLRQRIRVSSSRVKGSARLWSKMQKSAYIDTITSLASIPDVIDDLVGLRITCNNNIDVAHLRELLAGLPSSDDENEWICINPESEKRYTDLPKPSGYRAYHINLRTLLQSPTGWIPIRCELQSRTLLQDGWGELTHEDTYKPGVELPPLATKLARRMADLLAAVDDLAQDLRDELDRLAQESVETGSAEPHQKEADKAELAPSASLQSALLTETRRVIHTLTKAATLAEVAQQIQGSFGSDVTRTWGGYGSFSDLVRAAVPGAAILPGPPGVVLPPGFQIGQPSSELRNEARQAGVPLIVERLHAFEKNVPYGNYEKLDGILGGVEACLQQNVWMELDISTSQLGIRELNLLSKYGRDHAVGTGLAVPRHAVDYLLKGLLFSGNLRPGLTRDEIAEISSANIYARASSLGLVEDAQSDRNDLENWFAGTYS